MANVMRHRMEAMREEMCPVTATAAIDVGDLLVLFDADNMLNGTTYGNTANYKVVPFSAIQTAGVAADEAIASDHFIGVAMDASATDETDDILVATDGVFEFILDSATTINIADQLEVYSTGAGAVADQTVTKGTTDPLGRATLAGTSLTSVRVRIATAYRPVFA